MVVDSILSFDFRRLYRRSRMVSNQFQFDREHGLSLSILSGREKKHTCESVHNRNCCSSAKHPWTLYPVAPQQSKMMKLMLATVLAFPQPQVLLEPPIDQWKELTEDSSHSSKAWVLVIFHGTLDLQSW